MEENEYEKEVFRVWRERKKAEEAARKEQMRFLEAETKLAEAERERNEARVRYYNALAGVQEADGNQWQTVSKKRRIVMSDSEEFWQKYEAARQEVNAAYDDLCRKRERVEILEQKLTQARLDIAEAQAHHEQLVKDFFRGG